MSEAILNKIQRCLALADSSNPSEAAIALKQAKALMDKHNISDSDVLVIDVEEMSVPGTTKAEPAEWVLRLHNMVAKAFECEAIYVYYGGYFRCDLKFIGVTPSASIAAYTFDVLLRQLKRARQSFIKEKLSRYSKNKTKMADAFCVGWVIQVSNKCADINPNPKTAEKIKAYMDKEVQDLQEKSNKANKNSSKDDVTLLAMRHGYQAAEDVNLFVPVDGEEQMQIGGAL